MITDWFLPPFPTEKQALYCQPLWLPTSPPRLEFTIIAPRSAQLGFWLPTTCPARVCACVPHSHPGCPHHQQETTLSHFWVSEYHSGSFLLWINDLGSQTSAFFKMPHVVPTGGLAEKREGNPSPGSSWSRAFSPTAFIHVQALPIHELPTHILLPESWPGTKLENRNPDRRWKASPAQRKQHRCSGTWKGKKASGRGGRLPQHPALLLRPPDPRKNSHCSPAPHHPLYRSVFFSFRERKRPLQTAKIISWQLSNHTFNGLDVFKFLQQSLHFPLLFMLFFWKGHRT